MGEPFRDEMTAALTRAEKLAEENQDLRDELQRLRETAHSVRAQSPNDALATQALAVLERLESATHVDALPAVKKEQPVDFSKLTDLPKPASQLAARREGVRARTLLVACFVSLAIGIFLGAMTR